MPPRLAFPKPLTPQNCSIAYKYAQHLVLTNNKKNPSSRDSPFTRTNHHMTGKGRRKKKKPGLGLFFSAQRCPAWGDGWQDAWLSRREEGARGCALAAGGAEEAGSGPAAGEPCERPCGSTRCPGSRGRHRIATGDSGEDGAARRCFKRAASPHGFCLLLQRPRANSMYLEKEGRGWKSLSLQPRFQNYRVAWGGGRVRPSSSVWK